MANVYIDYRKLNSKTRKDHFPLLFLDQILERVAGHKYFLHWWLLGLYQIDITPEDQEKTAFTCPFGTFVLRKMSIGLCNAPATFQHCVLNIFYDIIEKICRGIHGRFFLFMVTYFITVYLTWFLL